MRSVKQSPNSIPKPFSRHAAALVAAVLVLLGFIWMVTYGSFELFDPEHLGQFYDAQAASLLAGHWDVPPAAIFPEGYYHAGKAYGYYGPVPALPRMVLNFLLPAMAGSWSRFSVTLACAVTLWCCYSILMRARHWISPDAPWSQSDNLAHGGFVLLAGLGSTVIYLGSRAFIFHEAIIWGVALALACYDQLLAYLMYGRWPRLLAACLLACLSFFSRISSGCGPCLALLLLGLNMISWRSAPFPARGLLRRLTAWTKPPPITHVAMIGVTLFSIVMMYAAVNHAKFGTFLQAAPMQLYEQVSSDPSRYARTHGVWMRLGNIPTVANAYLSPASLSFDPTFPWIFLKSNLRLLPGQHLDGWQPFTSVTASMPVFVILAIAGIGVIAMSRRQSDLGSVRMSPRAPPAIVSRRERAESESPDSAEESGPSLTAHTRREPPQLQSPTLVLLGSLGSIVPMLAFSVVDNRYLHEFFPFLVIAAAFGLHKLLAMRHGRLKVVLLVVLLALGSLQIYANIAFALVYQRLAVFDRPVRQQIEMQRWQNTIDHCVKKAFHFQS